jgi:selenocysteine lyase/cysteine desulfurase
VEERIIGLADRLRTDFSRSRVRIMSSLHPEIRSATTIWGIEGMNGGQLQDALWDRAKVRVRSMGEGVRQCCHIYNLEEEVDRALAAVRTIAKA